ncbi:hypothetical protein E9993_04475 [Labilibacter sediminis]|nr:hypothetical protein E9993_04475 [Labilibacter sediminis]
MTFRLLLIMVGLNMGVLEAQLSFQEQDLLALTVLELNDFENQMGINKEVPLEFSKPVYHALSYYPELKQTHIKFKYKKIGTTLNARPTIGSLFFRKKENRRYVIRINKTKADSVINFSDVPYNAQVGVLGHEFAHFIDYSQKGIWGVFKRLLSYTNKKGKEKFEKEIDQLTIDRGLGWQLHQWADLVLNDEKVNAKYKKLKQEIYLTPSCIEEYLSSLSPAVSF